MIHHDAWICNECGRTFSEPKKIPHGGGYDEEPWYECPFCGSDDYTLADYCVLCECVFPDEKLSYGLCEECVKKLAKDYANEYVTSDINVFDDFAWYIHKRIKDRSVSV